jgi:hypothetical protein
MRACKLNRIKALHHKVIHKFKGIGETEEEYLLEDKEITAIKSDYILFQICPKCFPILHTDADKKYLKSLPPRDSETYDIRYPKITTIVSAEEWNKAKK